MKPSDQKKVYVQTQTEIADTLPVTKEEIQNCIDFSLKASALDLLLPFAVNIRIVDYDEGLLLNRKYKKEHLPTNVLTFEGNLEQEKNLGIHPPFIGDVVICFGVELRILALHGFLHLLGFNHQNDNDETKMRELENEALKNFFILREMDGPKEYLWKKS